MEISTKNDEFWGVFMVVFMTLFEFKEKSFAHQFSDQNFYIIPFIFLGIFVLGYFNWNAKNKRENNQ